jgi:hypothetical protein
MSKALLLLVMLIAATRCGELDEWSLLDIAASW